MIRLRNVEFIAVVSARGAGADFGGSTAVNNWTGTLNSTGATVPNNDILNALTAFYNGLGADGLLSSMLFVMPMPPNSVGFVGPSTSAQDKAMLTPFIMNVGINPVAGAGLNPNNGNKDGYIGQPGNNFSLDPIIDITTAYSNDISAGITIYNMSGDDGASGGEGHADFGCFSGLGPLNEFALWSNEGNNGQFSCWNDSTGGVVSGAFPTSNFSGYVSGNRIGANDLRIFCANSGNAHAQIGSTVTTASSSGRIVGGNIFNHPFIYSENFQNYNGSAIGHSGKRLSFFALHTGLTQAQSLLFYNRVQTMRMAFGGGFA